MFYPPGIPLLMPGEIVTADILDVCRRCSPAAPTATPPTPRLVRSASLSTDQDDRDRISAGCSRSSRLSGSGLNRHSPPCRRPPPSSYIDAAISIEHSAVILPIHGAARPAASTPALGAHAVNFAPLRSSLCVRVVDRPAPMLQGCGHAYALVLRICASLRLLMQLPGRPRPLRLIRDDASRRPKRPAMTSRACSSPNARRCLDDLRRLSAGRAADIADDQYVCDRIDRGIQLSLKRSSGLTAAPRRRGAVGLAQVRDPDRRRGVAVQPGEQFFIEHDAHLPSAPPDRRDLTIRRLFRRTRRSPPHSA